MFFFPGKTTLFCCDTQRFSVSVPPPVFARRHQGLLLSGVRSGFGIRNPGATWRLPHRQHHWLKKLVQVTLTLSEPDSAMGYPGKVWKNGGFVEGLLIVENVWKSWRIWILLIFEYVWVYVCIFCMVCMFSNKFEWFAYVCIFLHIFRYDVSNMVWICFACSACFLRVRWMRVSHMSSAFVLACLAWVLLQLMKNSHNDPRLRWWRTTLSVCCSHWQSHFGQHAII